MLNSAKGKEATSPVQTPLRVYLSMTAAVAALASSSIIITSLQQGGTDPIIVAFYRMILATVLLTPVAMIASRRELISFTRRSPKLIAAAGFCLAVHFVSWIASLKYLPISTSVLLVSSHPFAVVLASRLFLDEKPPRRSLIGILLGFCGTAVIFWNGLKDLGLTLSGDLLALLGALALSGYVIIGRKIRGQVGLLAYVVPVYIACSLCLLAAAAATGARFYPYTPIEWSYFCLLALVPTVFGHTAMNWALRHLSASAVSMAFLGEPLVASLFAFVFFAQVPGLSTLIGGTLILIGIFLATISQAQKSH